MGAICGLSLKTAPDCFIEQEDFSCSTASGSILGLSGLLCLRIGTVRHFNAD